MSELKIVRGMDVTLYADETPLFGVTAFYASRKDNYHEVREYLCAKPCDRVAQGSVYELKLKLMSLFDQQLPVGRAFTLRVADGGESYCYGGCHVVGQQTEMKGNTHAVEVISIEADHMEKRTDNE